MSSYFKISSEDDMVLQASDNKEKGKEVTELIDWEKVDKERTDKDRR